MTALSWIAVDAALRARSAARATVAVVSCPECSASAGRMCVGDRYHLGRARIAGVDPSQLTMSQHRGVCPIGQTIPSSHPAPKPSALEAGSKAADKLQHISAITSPALASDPDAPRPRLDVVLHADRTSGHRVTVAERAASTIEEQIALTGGFIETGGLLVATTSSPGHLLIAEAGTPGPGSVRKANSYMPDHAHDTLWLAGLAEQFGDLRECGRWHLHPGSDDNRTPSLPDLQSFAASQALIGMNEFVGLIIASDGRALTATAWVTQRVRNGYGAPGNYWRCVPASKLEIQTDNRKLWSMT